MSATDLAIWHAAHTISVAHDRKEGPRTCFHIFSNLPWGVAHAARREEAGGTLRIFSGNTYPAPKRRRWRRDGAGATATSRCSDFFSFWGSGLRLFVPLSIFYSLY